MKRKALLKTLEGLLRERFSPEYAVFRLEEEGGPVLEVRHQENFGLPKRRSLFL